MRSVKVFALLAAGTFSTSCGTAGPAVFNVEYVIHLDENAPSGFRAILPDGKVFTDPEAYARYVPTITQQIVNEGSNISFRVGNRSCDESQMSSSDYGSMSQCLNGGGHLPLGYYFSFQISGTKPIGGCVKATCNPGGALRLHRNGNQLWDMHIGRFVRNGRTCLGMYESQSGWCISPCGPTYNDLRQGLYNAVIAVGVAASSAWLMAQAMAPVLLPALAL